MKIVLLGYLALIAFSASASEVNLIIIRETDHVLKMPTHKEIKSKKAEKLLREKGYFVTNHKAADKTVRIVLDEGCTFFSQCQDMKPRAQLKVINNETQEVETILGSTGSWPFSAKSLLDDVIGQL